MLIYSLVFVSLIIVMLTISWYVSRQDKTFPTDSDAASAFMVSSDAVSTSSYVQSRAQATYFTLNTVDSNTGFYTLSENSVDAVTDYISNKPSYNVQGDGLEMQLIHDDPDSIKLKERLEDKDIASFGLSALSGNTTHYYFEQTRCDGIPVYGSFLNVHVNESNAVYSMDGALAKPDAQCGKKLSNKDAEAIAKDRFQQGDRTGSTKITSTREYVYMESLSDTQGDQGYRTLRVEVCDDLTCIAYFVDLNSGDVRKFVPTTTDALNRDVSLIGSSTRRTEGSAASSNQHVNKVYDLLKQVYDFYDLSYQRDSYNDSGGKLTVKVDPNCGNKINAGWSGIALYMYVCTSTIGLDVIAHEYQHAVTQFTSGIEYVLESGGLNESISDVMAATIDSDDWVMGDEIVRVIRDMQNPPRFQQPDTVGSPLYVCWQPVETQDWGGVHVLSGVFNKAFYLMSDGGTFPATNGCQMSGIGRDNAAKIVYKATTVYMRNKVRANYRDMYDAMNQACADIYAAGGVECQSVKHAMESVGMDQQTTGQQRGIKCRNIQMRTPTCAGATLPSGTPSGTPSATVTPGVTTAPSRAPTVAPTTTAPTSFPTTAPSLTLAPTLPQPTTAPTQSGTARLLSQVSQPLSFGGEVRVSYDGTKYTLETELQEEIVASIAQRFLPEDEEGDEFSFYQGRLIGDGTQETGSFRVEIGDQSSRIFQTFESAEDLRRYTAYEVYMKAYPTLGIPEVPLFLADLSGVFGSSAQSSVNLQIKLRLQGIERSPFATQAQLVRIGVAGGELESPVYKRVVFVPGENGIWTGQVKMDVPAGSNYRILVKGPQHLQKRYCANNPQEESPGQYRCIQDQFELALGTNQIDFSSVTQLAGDINQDGIVNSQDVLSIRSNIGPIEDSLAISSDVNYDGVINAVDDALVIYTLANRTDE